MTFQRYFWRHSLMAAAAMLISVGGLPAVAQVVPVPLTRFRDTSSHWAATCIEGNRTMAGDGNGYFRPDASISRAEFAALLVAAFPNGQKRRSAPRFTDVSPRSWASKAIVQAYEWGYLSGYSESLFRPAEAISRAQAITMLSNAQNLAPAADADPAVLLQRYYSDAAAVPSYAAAAVAAATTRQQVVSYPNPTQLRPQANITRGEVAALLCQITIDGSDARYRVPAEYVVNLANRWRDRLALPETQVGGPFVAGLAPKWLGFDRFDLPVYGYVNSALETVLPGPYSAAGSFTADLAIAQISPNGPGSERLGWINPAGQWVIAPQFGVVYPFSEGLALVSRDSFPDVRRFEFIDRQGNTVFTPTQVVTSTFSEGRVAFSDASGKWGFLDRTGAVAIAAQFDAVEAFSGGLAQVSLGGKVGFINPAGAVVIPIRYAEAGAFSDGLAAARLATDAPWGYLDPAGNWAIAPQFQAAQHFSEGLAGVGVGSGTAARWGFIDRSGQRVIAPQFYAPAPPPRPEQLGIDQPQPLAAIEPFREGVAAVRIGNQVGLIDRQGQWRLSPQAFDGLLSSVSTADRGLAAVVFEDGSSGLIRLQDWPVP